MHDLATATAMAAGYVVYAPGEEHVEVVLLSVHTTIAHDDRPLLLQALGAIIKQPVVHIQRGPQTEDGCLRRHGWKHTCGQNNACIHRT